MIMERSYAFAYICPWIYMSLGCLNLYSLELYFGCLDLYLGVWTSIWVSGLVFGCLDLYFECLDLYSSIRSCIVGVWTSSIILLYIIW